MLYLSIQTYRSPNPSETATFEGYKNINTGEINLFSGQHNHRKCQSDLQVLEATADANLRLVATQIGWGIPKLSYRDGPTGPGRR